MRFQFSLSSSLLLIGIALAQPDPAELKKKPITTDQGPVGKLLKQWHAEGTAAGNVGDFYDNRDGAHSDLNTAPYPQMQRFVYSPDDIKQRKHWAAARETRPHVTIGNSSTSAPAQMGGSNPRHYYCSTFGLSLLAEQYAKNNIYIYPEHREESLDNSPIDGMIILDEEYLTWVGTGHETARKARGHQLRTLQHQGQAGAGGFAAASGGGVQPRLRTL